MQFNTNAKREIESIRKINLRINRVILEIAIIKLRRLYILSISGIRHFLTKTLDIVDSILYVKVRKIKIRRNIRIYS